MIDEAPILTIAEGFERPPAELVDAMRGMLTSQIVDAMGGSGAVDWRIKPIVPGQDRFCGVARTSDCGPCDNLALMASIADCKPGDVLVTTTAGYEKAAVTGDLTLGMARNQGVVGFVTDGMVRDLEGIRDMGVPCFARGLVPNSPARSGPGTVDLPIVLGDVVVRSGDVVVGDPDGVVIVPRERLAQVAEALKAVRAAEAATLAKVQGGLTVFPFVADLLASGRVRRV
ncbi:MAG TPA: hypothetical protein VHL31_10540 [Geminicoccus sp.]|jgi:4-hydroxy-4-methyl-2-oxoglutarate aldolase|uniref:RraA family protein n=1 Tax=Geminicoccus sp. TaxID=2024832 RepID=UPI002E32C99B|nr:hypothetical protein [Geminicoccus sp.]HEX2526718.1 hypothetical protein [Geminicoccus sp.]